MLPVDLHGWAGHVELLTQSSPETHAINTILQYHNLPHNKSACSLDRIKDYQPEAKQEWIDHFHNLRNKENKMWYVDWCVKGIFFSVLLYILYTKYLINTFSV